MPVNPKKKSMQATGGWIAAGLLLSLLAARCAQAPRDPAPAAAAATGGTVVYGEGAEPRELNCLRASDASSVRVCRLICDSLLAYGPDLAILPRLAQSFETSPDGTTITFHLRPDARWHDGKRVTSEDVIYTVRQIRAKDSMIRGNLPAFFESLVSITAPDDKTVVAVYREPYALVYQAWARTFIMPAHLPFDPGASSPLDRAPVCSGPFEFGSWDPGQQLVLDAFDGYPGGRPRIDHLVFRFVSDSHTRAVALDTGELDVAPIRPADLEGLPADPRYGILRYPRNAVNFILWNIAKPGGLFADARVRRAMSLALDRQGFIEHISRGNDTAAVSTFSPSSWAHDPKLAPLPHDPARAAELLAEAGWKDRDGDGILDTDNGPAEFTLLILSGSTEQESVGTMLKEALAPMGVIVKLQALEWPVLLQKVRGGTFDASAYQWNQDEDPDPYDFFHSSQAKGGQNYGGYSNAEVDRLAEAGRRTTDQAARAEIYHKVEKILRDEQPYTFISHPGAIVGVSRRLRDVKVGTTGIFGWYPGPLSWWIPAGQQRKP